MSQASRLARALLAHPDPNPEINLEIPVFECFKKSQPGKDYFTRWVKSTCNGCLSKSAPDGKKAVRFLTIFDVLRFLDSQGLVLPHPEIEPHQRHRDLPIGVGLPDVLKRRGDLHNFHLLAYSGNRPVVKFHVTPPKPDGSDSELVDVDTGLTISPRSLASFLHLLRRGEGASRQNSAQNREEEEEEEEDDEHEHEQDEDEEGPEQEEQERQEVTNENRQRAIKKLIQLIKENSQDEDEVAERLTNLQGLGNVAALQSLQRKKSASSGSCSTSCPLNRQRSESRSRPASPSRSDWYL